MICRHCHHAPSGRFDANGFQCHCDCHNMADAAVQFLGELIPASEKVAMWISPALDDPNVCKEMKTAVEDWGVLLMLAQDLNILPEK